MSYLVSLFLLCFITYGQAWFNDPGKVPLTDVKAITLHQGQYTTGRRNPSVPQLKCLGGSAGCSAFTPKVVQCRNVGSDGLDVQWECKADMDDSYRFGKIQVSCEGYDYPNDPYILKGSCGLEYTLDYTEKGQRKLANNYQHFNGNYHHNSTGSNWKCFFLMIVIGFILYKIGVVNRIRNCINQYFRQRYNSSDNQSDHRSSPTPKPHHPTAPPPPTYNEATSTEHGRDSSTSNQENSPGFWSGLGLGGILAYFTGSRNKWWSYDNGYYSGYSPRFHSGWNTRWRSSSPSWFSSSHRRSSSGSTSRTTSGFGGTTRR